MNWLECVMNASKDDKGAGTSGSFGSYTHLTGAAETSAISLSEKDSREEQAATGALRQPEWNSFAGGKCRYSNKRSGAYTSRA
jgi:hypothetical protein